MNVGGKQNTDPRAQAAAPNSNSSTTNRTPLALRHHNSNRCENCHCLVYEERIALIVNCVRDDTQENSGDGGNPYKQSGGYPQQPHGRPYTGPVFTPGGGHHPQSSPQSQPMRSPLLQGGGYPPHQQQQPQYQPRGRGPPRSGPHPQQQQQHYMQRSAVPYYPQMQQLPPPYMIGSQPGMNMYLPPGTPMQYYPLATPGNMGMPAGGMPLPTHQSQFQAPQKRERKPAEIRHPKTRELIDLTGMKKKDESAAPAAPAAATPTPTPTTKTESPAVKAKEASAPASPKKEEVKQLNGAPMSPLKKAATEKPALPNEHPAKKPEAAMSTESKVAPKSPAKTLVKNDNTAVAAPAAAATVASPKKTTTSKEPEPASPTKTLAKSSESPKKKAPVASLPPTESQEVPPPEKAAAKSVRAVATMVNGKITYAVDVLFSFREAFTELPADATGSDTKWPSMEVVNDGPARASSRGGRGGSGGGGGSNWERSESKSGAALTRQTSRGATGGGGGGGNQWARSQDLPKRGRGERGGGSGRGGGGGGRGGRGQQQEPLFDGPVKPLERTDNRWIPVKATSGLEATKKKVYSIMNKMTREKFTRLAAQLTDIDMESLEMLQSVITILFDKALGEPHFCDMYADLCVFLEQRWKVWSFLQIVQNDDDNTFYWTTMAEADSEVVGPFASLAEALEAAKSDEFEPSPAPVGMKLSEVRVQNNKFIKVWASEAASGQPTEFYWSGQLLEDLGDDQALNGPFESFDHANRTAVKACSFKRILLNACQEEFEKDNIYEELEATYKANKLANSVTPEMEAEYQEKRMLMKARMLGNIRFIGELYRKGMLQERIMHECIMKLMGVAVKDGTLALVHPSDNPDEENIESLCKLLATMGKDLDKGLAQAAMNGYFTFLEKVLLKDKRLCSRINFMIKDVLDLRLNRWEQRRKELKTMTLDEIRKEAERELQKPPVSAPSGGGGGGGGGRSDPSSFRRSSSSRDNNNSFSSQGGRATMAPIYSSQSMSSRSSGGNASSRMVLPNPRGIQRDDSVKTGPQGRPASFGAAGARRGGLGGSMGGSGTGGSPASFSSRSRNAPLSAAGASSAASESSGRSAKKAEPTVRAALSADAKEKIAKRAKSTAEEYVSIVDIREAEACLSELVKEFNGHPEVPHVFAKEILQLASDAKNSVRESMFDLLEKLVLESKAIPPESIRFGLEKMIELAVDLWCDVPKLHEHVADIVVRFMKQSATTGVTFDWLVCGCGQRLEADVFDELVQGGFLAATAGQTLQLLRAADPAKAKSEVRSTYSTLHALFAPHDQNAASIQKWIAKFELSDVFPLEPAFGLVELANTSTASYSDVVAWIEQHIPLELRTDALFATHMCLFILESGAKAGSAALPSQERCMLLTGFCGDVETQVRLVSGIFQTRTDSGAFIMCGGALGGWVSG